MARWKNPLLEQLPVVKSCVHCRTVTWAGVPACGCPFGVQATDDAAVAALLGPDGRAA